jgi:hypothetical protein
MALSQSDLIRLPEPLRTAYGVETIRVLCERIPQELIEAEATEVIGCRPGRALREAHHLAQRPPGEAADHPGPVTSI